MLVSFMNQNSHNLISTPLQVAEGDYCWLLVDGSTPNLCLRNYFCHYHYLIFIHS